MESVRLNDTDPNKEWARDSQAPGQVPQATGRRAKRWPCSSVREANIALSCLCGWRMSITSAPHIQEFLWALDEYEVHMVALMAEDEARVLRVGLGRTATDSAVISDQKWLRKQRKSAHTANLKSRQDELTRRFVRTIAADADKYFLKIPISSGSFSAAISDWPTPC
ncbi:MAG: hypothetical protein IPM60_15375 [Rhodospirillales bacterium]|nr:hypothetical protein [Rhodospirillales bacterium]